MSTNDTILPANGPEVGGLPEGSQSVPSAAQEQPSPARPGPSASGGEVRGRASEQRLMSLDVLRGLDIMLLTVIGPFFYAYNRSFGLSKDFMRQFEHGWGGFTLWDIIMPMFIFISGAAVPLALERRKRNGRAGWGYWWHVLCRVVLLWVLGMVAQGRLLTMDARMIDPFNNTLQTIACGYLACAGAYLIRKRWIRAAIPVILAVGYAIWLHSVGDYSKNMNAAICFDRWLIPFVTPEKSRVLALADPGYTWWATIPMFAAMGLCGMEATEILRSPWHPANRGLALGVLGGVLLGVGWAFVPVIPPIKHIFTFTFTAQAMGWCCLSLALLYLLLDVLGKGAVWLQRCLWLPILFGQTALLAYVCTNAFGRVQGAWENMFGPGFGHLFGPWADPMGRWLASTVLLVAILYNRRNCKRWCRLQSKRRGGGDGAMACPAASGAEPTGGVPKQWAIVGAALLAAGAWAWRWILKGLSRFWLSSRRLWRKVSEAWRNPLSTDGLVGTRARFAAVGAVLRDECVQTWRRVREWCPRFLAMTKQRWRRWVQEWKNRMADAAEGKAGRWAHAGVAVLGICATVGRWLLKELSRVGVGIRNGWRKLLLAWQNRRRERQA